ncbi:MAG: hypothetical protein DSM106950_39225 [Stigonema ocellatum SAG 48.90 = DSM 106950]|nr:hypothetical protein [Stigonema ocellatum SAG 48.90 = DSM 106950]
MRTIRGSVDGNIPTAATQSYSASVPLSIYRELVAELEDSQARINELAAQNQQLAQENQILRQEIAKAVQSFLHLQKLVDSHNTASYNQDPHYDPDFIGQTKRSATEARPHFTRDFHRHSPVVPWSEEINSPMPETFFIEEEEEVNYYQPSEPEAIDVPSWKLIITILLIILMGFGAGYLIVRPLFEHHGR